MQEERYRRTRDKNTKGMLLRSARLHAGLECSELCYGICIESEYINVEQGRRIPPKLVMDTLWQRAGISAEQMESVVSVEEYNSIRLMDQFADAVSGKDERKAERLLLRYRRGYGNSHLLHTQIWQMLQGVRDIYLLQDYPSAKKNLLEAFLITQYEYKGDYAVRGRLGYVELSIYILMLMADDKMGEDIDTVHALEMFWRMEKITGAQDYVRLCPVFAWVLSGMCYRRGMTDEAMAVAGKGIKALVKGRRLYCIAGLLEIWYCSVRKAGHSEYYDKADTAKLMKKTLDELYQEFEITEDISWYLPYRTSEIYPIDQVIRVRREALGFSQEYLSTGICSGGTVSRIERGLSNPKNMIRAALLNAVGMDSADYGRINSKSFDVHLLEEDFYSAMNRGDFVRAGEMLEELSYKLDKDNIVNSQYLQYMRVLLEGYSKGKDITNTRYRLRQILELTFHHDTGRKQWIYSRNELNITLNIARLYAAQGEYGTARKLFILIEKFLRGQRLEMSHFLNAYCISQYYHESFEANYASVEEALELAYPLARVALTYGGTATIGRILYDIGWNIEKREEKEGKFYAGGLKYMKYAYALSLIVDNRQALDMITRNISRKYGDPPLQEMAEHFQYL